MKILRYLNVINDQNDLDHVQKMINMFSSNRSWHFQGSTSDKDVAFFFSNLIQSELDLFYKYFNPIIQKEYNFNLELERAYINCNPPMVGGQWHTDGDNGITILYYPLTKFKFGDQGGTEFEHHGVEKYIGNSIILFPAELKHRALEHQISNAYRFSIAIKLRRT